MKKLICSLSYFLLTGITLAESRNQNPLQPTIVVRWNEAALQGVRESTLGPPMISRALAIIHTCIYDAWTAFDEKAVPVYPDKWVRLRRGSHNEAAVDQAISFAAYRCAFDLMPGSAATVYRPLMQQLGYDPDDLTLDPASPQGIGNIAAYAVLDARHRDGSNQLGTLTPGGIPYADYTGYSAVNPPSTVPVLPSLVRDMGRWQPLQYVDPSGAFVTQKCMAPFWGSVVPFGLSSGQQFRSLVASFGPILPEDPRYLKQARDLIELSAALTDQQKMIAEYWADGPRSETPPGHWNLFAQFVSARDRHNTETDVKMFFALTNSVFDAGIVVWDAKRHHDSSRPITVIPTLFQGQTIRAWGGPGRGTVTMDGRAWTPYQSPTFPTPPFPEFVSGHSAFSAAAAEILRLFTNSDEFGAEVSLAAGSSHYEPGATPSSPVTLRWPTFSAAADEAGLSRRYGGIHFEAGDLAGRAAGRSVAAEAWRKASSLWRGGHEHERD